MIEVIPNLKSIADHDGAVILDIPHDAMTTLDAVGGYVWQRLERGVQLEAIVADLSRETGEDEARIAKDLEAFIEELKSCHLVITTDDGHRGRGHGHG